jgi:hypothetical protein
LVQQTDADFEGREQYTFFCKGMTYPSGRDIEEMRDARMDYIL